MVGSFPSAGRAGRARGGAGRAACGRVAEGSAAWGARACSGVCSGGRACSCQGPSTSALPREPGEREKKYSCSLGHLTQPATILHTVLTLPIFLLLSPSASGGGGATSSSSAGFSSLTPTATSPGFPSSADFPAGAGGGAPSSTAGGGGSSPSFLPLTGASGILSGGGGGGGGAPPSLPPPSPLSPLSSLVTRSELGTERATADPPLLHFCS